MPERGPSPGGEVIVCEPQFRRSTHATFNAGLLAAAARAFPEARLVFAAHPSQASWVHDALPAGDPAAGAILRPLPELPSLGRSGRLRRTAAELRVWLGILARARRSGARLVLFTSTTKLGALLLVLACRAGSPRVLAVMHQVFELAGPPPPGRPPSLVTVVGLPQPAALRFVAPSSAVGAALAAARPRLARRFTVLEPAYFWQRDEPPAPPSSGARFGLFGRAGHSRLEPLLDLAHRLGPAAGARFRVVGYVPESVPLATADAALLGHPARRPLPLDELSRRAAEVDYALWLGGEDYELRLSASFLDALSHLRPLVALDSSFAAHYFRELGDVGVLCRGPEELAATVARLASGVDPDHYRGWCRRMLDGRRRFDPAAVGVALRAAMQLSGGG